MHFCSTNRATRQVLVQQIRIGSNDAERVSRLTSLLAEALSRSLGQVNRLGPESSAQSVDYSADPLPTTNTKYTLPRESK